MNMKLNFLKGLVPLAFVAFGITNASAQNSLGCQDHVNVSLTDACAATLTPTTFGAGTTGTIVTIKDGTNVLTAAQGFSGNGTGTVTISQVAIFQL